METSWLTALPESLTTVPVSVPAFAPVFSELSAETETPDAAIAGVTPTPSAATVNKDAPMARPQRTSMSTPSMRALWP